MKTVAMALALVLGSGAVATLAARQSPIVKRVKRVKHPKPKVMKHKMPKRQMPQR